MLFRRLPVVLIACFFGWSAGAFAADDTASVLDDLGIYPDDTAVSARKNWQTPQKIVVYGRLMPREAVQQLAPNAEVTILDFGDVSSPAIADADVIIGSCSAGVLAAAKKVRWIQHYAAGVENCVGIEGLKSRDILLTNMQRVSSPAIAEHAIGLMFGIARHLPEHERARQAEEWGDNSIDRRSYMELTGKNMLVVGLGGIGSNVAQRAAGLGMRVTATRNSSHDGPDYVDYVGLSDEMLTLAKDADVIVNALPLTPATTAVFDKEFFAVLKPTAIFINVARGASVVTDELVKALNEGRIAGAGVDVTDPEPLPPGHPLWSAKNVIITPHMAGASDVSLRRYGIVVLENLRRYVAGEPMLNVVDIERGY